MRQSRERLVKQAAKQVATLEEEVMVNNDDIRVRKALALLGARERYEASEKGKAARAKAQAKQRGRQKTERAALKLYQAGDIEGARALLNGTS